LDTDVNALWHTLIPLQIVGIIMVLFFAAFMGILEKRRGAGLHPTGKAAELDEDASSASSAPINKAVLLGYIDQLKEVGWEHLGLIPTIFERLGITLERRGDDIYIPAHTEGYEIQNFIDGSILTVYDAPWPGFTPDLLSIILVTAIQARGEVLVHQKMFESRLFFVDKLIDMGAKIILCDPHRAVVIGNDFKSRLRATTMTSPDIRAGVALLIAALSAKGTSTIHNIEQIDRGYECIEERLQAIGARITRV